MKYMPSLSQNVQIYLLFFQLLFFTQNGVYLLVYQAPTMFVCLCMHAPPECKANDSRSKPFT